jgi:hypothetical protein
MVDQSRPHSWNDAHYLHRHALNHTADFRFMRYSLKQDPRLLEEVGDLSMYLTYLKSAVNNFLHCQH